MNNNQNSKKRSFNQFNAQRQADENLLFGNNGMGGDNDQFVQRDTEDQFYEAQEDNDEFYHEQENNNESEDEQEGEDLMENAHMDYEENERLDRYEADGLDNEEQVELNAEQRREIDRQLRMQQRMDQRQNARAPNAYLSDDVSEDETDMIRQQQRRQLGNVNELDDDANYNDAIDYAQSQGPVSDWVQKKEVRFFINKRFSSFLRTFKDENDQYVYEQRIHNMCLNNKQSLEIDFMHLSNKQPTLAIWLAEEPKYMLPILNVVASELVLEVYPDYQAIAEEIFVRFKSIPVDDKLRDLRQVHLNAMIKIKGVVTKRTGVQPELKESYFLCVCGDLKGPFEHQQGVDTRQLLGQCVKCYKYGPYTIDESQTKYRNYQKLTIQETPGSIPPGRVPRQKEVIVSHDLVDTARPGDEIEVIGIYKSMFDYFANVNHGFPVFKTSIEANNIRRFGDEDVVELTDEDKKLIRETSRKPNIANKIINSIAPSIYGHNFIKKGLSLAMFGGEAKDVGGKHRIRGDINMLLLGDPGTAKSQFLKYVEHAFHRVVYTTGKGASAVGLTAGVHKDPITREWTLEGGALVLADKGICLIDEFDKMNDQDRTSIHEAMEQQSISISKAGIVTSLQARCSVIAAANPLSGVYNPSINFTDNVNLTDPILSRFDILSVIRDEANEELDDALATFVINSHIKNHPTARRDTDKDNIERDQNVQILQDKLLPENKINHISDEDYIDQDLLRKYILYARKYVHPKLNEIDKEKVTNFYSEIRKQSSVAGGIPIAVRHIESMLRMSEAHAKMHLRDYVRSDDIDFAIEMLCSSFLQSQKTSVATSLKPKLEPFIEKNKTGTYQLLMHILDKLSSEKAVFKKFQEGIEEDQLIKVDFKVKDFEAQARDLHAHNLNNFYKSQLFCSKFILQGNTITSIGAY